MNSAESSSAWKNPTADEIGQIIARSKTIAVVGMSAKPDRASYGVAKYLMEHGFDIIPVNPVESEILGQKVFPNLSAIGRPIDIVDVFRQSDATPPIVKEAIAIGAKYIWLQEGVVSEESYQLAKAAGVPIIMDRCIAKEHFRMRG